MRKPDMRKLILIMTAGTVLFALAGFAIRTVERASAFEPLTNLPVRNAPSAQALIGMTTLFLLLAFAVSFVFYKSKSEIVMARSDNKTYGFVLGAAIVYGAALTIASVVYIYSSRNDQTLTRVDFVYMYLCGFAGISAFISYPRPRAEGENWLRQIASLMPEIFCASWLIYLYHQNQTNPVVIAFLPRVFAIAAATMAFYFEAGFVFNRKAPARLLFFHCAALFLGAVSLADPLSFSERLIFAATELLLLANLIRFALAVRSPEPEPGGNAELT